MRPRCFAVLLACSCGRIGFGASGDDVVTPDDAKPVDAPKLPDRLVCTQRSVALPHVGAGGDLAVGTTGTDLIALWAAPGERVSGALVSLGGVLVEPLHTFETGPVRAIAGMMVLPNDALAFTTASQSSIDLWYATAEALTNVKSEPGRVFARDPLVSDAPKSSRAFVRGDASGLVFTYFDISGNLGSDRPFSRNPIVSIAAADNSDHTHVTWEENNAGSSDCYQADLDLIPTAPDIGGFAIVANDCHEPRIDSGPSPADAIFNVWRTTPRTIEARYHGGTDDVSTRLSTKGRGPRIRFDGSRFWSAWIEESSGVDVLRVAQIEIPTLVFMTVDLPGWTVVGDEAFEFVRIGSVVYLVLLGADSLTVMKTCAG